MAKRWGPVALVLVVMMLVVGACGESDPDTGSDGATEAPRNTVTPTEAPTATAEATEEETSGTSEAPPTKGFEDLQQWDTPPPLALENNVDYQAKITTNFGEITVDLFEKEAPQTVNSFVFLANEGFYENVPIHRILSGFVIQSGDPTGTGRGGPGYRFNDEPVVREYTKGILAMANAGPNTNGSQFFIVLDDLSGRLPKNYTIFGEVTEGIEVVDQIAAVEVTASETGEPSKPTEPVFISNIEIVQN